MTVGDTKKLSSIEANLNRLKARRALLEHQEKVVTKRKRMQRTRTLTQ